MFITIFEFMPPYRAALHTPLCKAIAEELSIPLSSIILRFSEVPIRPPWCRGPIRVLATGEDAWRKEGKIDRIVSRLCEEYFVAQGGYAYNFWFGCEEPNYANQLPE